MMNPEIKAQWIAALRSGSYDQCIGRLTDGTGYCCLGVLREITGLPPSKDTELLDYTPAFKIGLRFETQETLSRMNDGGLTFAEIADHIEATL